jgi:hypothetical protein
MKPITGKITSKRYRCQRCGHEQKISTNHYGECYSAGHSNCCPKCPPWAKFAEFGSSTTWVCVEPLPAGMERPANWVKAVVVPHLIEPGHLRD